MAQKSIHRGSGISQTSKRHSSKKSSNNQIIGAVGSIFCSGNSKVKNMVRTSTNFIKEPINNNEHLRGRRSRFQLISKKEEEILKN